MEYISYILGCVMIALCILGFCGNILTILIYSRKRMRKTSINILIVGLSVADLGLLTASVFVFAIPPITIFINSLALLNFVNYSTLYLYPLCSTLQTASVLIYTAISVERFIAVCYPLMLKSLCTPRSARRSLAIAALLAVAYNAVRVQEYGINLDEVRANNYTNETLVVINLVPLLRANADYVLWYTTMGYFVTHITPSTVVCFLSGVTLHKLMISIRNRINLTARERSEFKTAIMMVCVIFIFVITYGYSFGLNLYEVVHPEMFSNAEPLAFLLSDVSNTLVVFNSASTVGIYAIFSRKYRQSARRIFRQLLCQKRPTQPTLAQYVSVSVSDAFHYFLVVFDSTFEGSEPVAVSRARRGYRHAPATRSRLISKNIHFERNDNAIECGLPPYGSVLENENCEVQGGEVEV